MENPKSIRLTLSIDEELIIRLKHELEKKEKKILSASEVMRRALIELEKSLSVTA